MNGAVGGGLFSAADRSFHPNANGHQAYASALSDYIDLQLLGGAERTAVGLPANPSSIEESTAKGATSRVRGSAEADDESWERAMRHARRIAEASPPSPEGEEEYVWFEQRHVTSRTGDCVVPAPGEDVVFSAEGFAPGSLVEVVQSGARSVQVDGVLVAEDLSMATLEPVRVNAAGRLEFVWTVPEAPSVPLDPGPRGYSVEATGIDPSGEVLLAFPVPVIVYPGVVPCAVDDAASTTVGQTVRIGVLENDVLPPGGSWDPASFWFDRVGFADVVVDQADGSVLFTPDPGFVGVETFEYLVRDNWGYGVLAKVTVTVDAGCTITGTAGATDIVGTEGDDVICVPDPDDPTAFHIIDARGGDDIILGGDGIDWIDGGPGADTIYARRGADRIDGGAGVDTIHGGRGFDTVRSVDFADVIHGDAGDELDGYELVVVPAAASVPDAPVVAGDEAYAATGEVLLVDVLGNDYDPDGDLDDATLTIIWAPTGGAAEVLATADLGAYISYTAGVADGVDSFTYQVCDRRGACATAVASVTVGTGACTIFGTDGDDTLSGTAGADVICGGGGDDVIYGLGGNDVLVGGAGDDTLYGGDETRIGDSDGDDVLFGGAGDDTLYGGNGSDTLWGGAGADTLEGNRRDDSLFGGAGADSLNGGGEDDSLFGGPGDDTLVGHAHNDTLHGGLGDDTLIGGNGDDTLWGDAGDDDLTGGAGDDALHGGAGDDTMHGNTQDDILWGGPGADTLRGGGHNDTVYGGTGGDSLRGDAGDDSLFGGWGDDTLDGGNGTDYLGGGPDTDTCGRGETTARCER